MFTVSLESGRTEYIRNINQFLKRKVLHAHTLRRACWQVEIIYCSLQSNFHLVTFPALYDM